MNCKLFCIGFSILIAFCISNIFSFIGLFKNTLHHSFENCEKIKTGHYIEDLVEFEENLIGGSADYKSMFFQELSASKAYPGILVSMDPVSEKFSKVKINNMPSEFSFNPHGMNLFNKKMLYVISHGYKNGAEMIFVFELFKNNHEIEANFVKVIKLSNEHGVYNAIAVINENNFYISKFLPEAENEEGRNFSGFTTLKNFIYMKFISKNSIKLCRIEGETASCQVKYKGMMPNGLVISKNHLFASETGKNTIEIFEISKNLDLLHINTVQVSHLTDNLFEKNGKIFVTGTSTIIDVVKHSYQIRESRKLLHPVSGGVSMIYFKDNHWHSKEILMQNILDFPTASLIIGEKLILSSITDNSFLICPLKNLSI